jgi:hypothetical protein
MQKEIKRTIDLIREKISKRGNILSFSKEIKVKSATLYNFLNGKKGINTDTFFRIITPLGLMLEGNEKMIEVGSVWIDGTKVKSGWKYKGKEIVMCFGDASSSKQFVLLKDELEKHELVIC